MQSNTGDTRYSRKEMKFQFLEADRCLGSRMRFAGMLFGQTIADVMRHNESPLSLLLFLCLLSSFGFFKYLSVMS